MIVTEDQEITLNFLNKYSQMFYKFSDYNNYPQWLNDETKLDNAIDAVRAGTYEEDGTMEQYINECIQAVLSCMDESCDA